MSGVRQGLLYAAATLWGYGVGATGDAGAIGALLAVGCMIVAYVMPATKNPPTRTVRPDEILHAEQGKVWISSDGGDTWEEIGARH